MPTALLLIVSLQSYLPMFTHSLAHCLASLAIPRVYSLEHSLEPYPCCHSLITITMNLSNVQLLLRSPHLLLAMIIAVKEA